MFRHLAMGVVQQVLHLNVHLLQMRVQQGGVMLKTRQYVHADPLLQMFGALLSVLLQRPQLGNHLLLQMGAQLPGVGMELLALLLRVMGQILEVLVGSIQLMVQPRVLGLRPSQQRLQTGVSLSAVVIGADPGLGETMTEGRKRLTGVAGALLQGDRGVFDGLVQFVYRLLHRRLVRLQLMEILGERGFGQGGMDPGGQRGERRRRFHGIPTERRVRPHGDAPLRHDG